MIYRKFYRFVKAVQSLHEASLRLLFHVGSTNGQRPRGTDQEALELVQKFALRLCCKNWSAAYLQLLDSTSLTMHPQCQMQDS